MLSPLILSENAKDESWPCLIFTSKTSKGKTYAPGRFGDLSAYGVKLLDSTGVSWRTDESTKLPDDLPEKFYWNYPNANSYTETLYSGPAGIRTLNQGIMSPLL